MRDSFDKHYMPVVQIKDFIALIDNKKFLDHPVKTNKKPMKKLFTCQKMMTTQQKIC